tara:strand:- start:3119 stop:3454 length:336 start_codon:yes stop_codon:yes gene_type:complete
MDWSNLLLAVGLVYVAYEAGRWAQREDFKRDAEIHVMIMKAFEKAQQQNHYQSIVDHNEEMEKAKEDYEKGNKELWDEIEQDRAKWEAEELANQIEKTLEDDDKKDDDRTN